MAKLIDITGQRFGRLVAVRYVGNKKWLFKCDCGKEKVIARKSVISGDSKSCGCLAKELTRARSISRYGNLTEIAKENGIQPSTLSKRIQRGMSLEEACKKPVSSDRETLEGETWQPVVGYEDSYEVSSFGRVYSKERVVTRNNGTTLTIHPRILKPHFNKKGYECVNLSLEGEHSDKFVHRLVAKTFIPCENTETLDVNHKDESRANNSVNNLEWLTHKDNVNYGTHNQRVKEWQERNGWHELRKRRVTLLVDGVEVATYSSLTDAANDTGVNISTICACCRGRKNPTRKGHLWRYAEEVNP